MVFRRDKVRRPQRPQANSNAPVATSVAVTGVGVRVTFDRDYANDLEGELKPSAEVVFNRIADVTGTCQVIRNNLRTVELLGQQDNPYVNTLEAIQRTVRGERPRTAAQPMGRALTSAGWVLFVGPAGREAQVHSLAGVPNGAPVRVEIRLAVTSGVIRRSEVESLRPVVATLPQGELLTPDGPRTPILRYNSYVSVDVALANEVGELLQLLGRAL